MSVVVASALGKRFGERWAVRDLELSIEAGETFALIGPSGCGKTTTLRMFNRLVEPTSGRLKLFGEDALATDPTRLRRRVGYAIQDVGLFPHYSVRQNVSVVPELFGWPRSRIQARVDELLELLGLSPAEFGDRYPHELSGGQRQRVGIARALAADPPLVLLDEPFGALDPITRESVQDEFIVLSRRLDTTFVLVTHDVFEAVRLADRIGVMSEGCLIQVATPAELVKNPQDDVVTGLLGRHRFQLRLMTLRLADVLAGRPVRSQAAGPSTLAAHADDSVWSALDRMESGSYDEVSVELDERACVSTRAELLEWSSGDR